jgi:chaperone modulatory protein CbpM
MISLNEVLERLDDALDRATVEKYVTRSWVKSAPMQQEWQFEDIDVARIRLVHQLQHDMLVNDEAMDVVLHLLDQLYGLHEQMRRVQHAVNRQPEHIRAELMALLAGADHDYS